MAIDPYYEATRCRWTGLTEYGRCCPKRPAYRGIGIC